MGTVILVLLLFTVALGVYRNALKSTEDGFGNVVDQELQIATLAKDMLVGVSLDKNYQIMRAAAHDMEAAIASIHVAHSEEGACAAAAEELFPPG